MAERNGLDFRRRLRSAERLSDSATSLAWPDLNTSCSRSSASLVSVTCADHLRVEVVDCRRRAGDRRAVAALAMFVLQFLCWRTLPSSPMFRRHSAKAAAPLVASRLRGNVHAV